MDNIRLVEQLKSGDRNAFALLYETYLPTMRKVVAYYIHNSDVIWDVIHDGFIVAFTSIDTLRNGAKVEAWLTTIMKNLSIQYLREESRHKYFYVKFERKIPALVEDFCRSNNEDLILAIQSAGVSRGRNGFRKDKSGEKLAESEEDLLEHRTDGTDAFDTISIGAKNSLTTILLPSPCRAYRKKSCHVYIYVKLFRNFALLL